MRNLPIPPVVPLVVALVVALSGATAAIAQDASKVTWKTLELEGLAPLTFGMAVPTGEPEGPIPVLLVLPPGGQDQQLAEVAINLYFGELLPAAGWVVLSPVLPKGQSAPGDFEPWLDGWLEALPKILGREISVLHLAGISNGGRSAMSLAGKRSERFASLTVMPGLMGREADADAISRVASLPVTMLVGGEDQSWIDGGRRTEKLLLERGARGLEFEVFEGEGHVLSPSFADQVVDRILRRERERLERLEHAAQIEKALDLLHRSAATADEVQYFDLFTPDAVFVGTDASERWTLARFRAFSSPYFQGETAWTYAPYERHIEVDPGLEFAWFDEKLENESYGDTRGSGVLRRSGDRWRVAHYVLSFAVPNEKASDVVEVIRDGK